MERDELKTLLSALALPQVVELLGAFQDELAERDLGFCADDLAHIRAQLERRLYGVRRGMGR